MRRPHLHNSNSVKMQSSSNYEPKVNFFRPKARKDGKINYLMSLIFFGNGGWKTAKPALMSMAQPENWGRSGIILKNYIEYLFTAVVDRYLEDVKENGYNSDYVSGVFFSDDEQFMAFNTGLYTAEYSPIYMHCARNKKTGMQPWYFVKWATKYDLARVAVDNVAVYRLRPAPFVFFKEFHELYYLPEVELVIQENHILEDSDGHDRVRSALIELGEPDVSDAKLLEKLQWAVSKMRVRVAQNSRTVVPQFFKGQQYQGCIQLLLPLSFKSNNEVQLVIPVTKTPKALRRGEVRDHFNPAHWLYTGATVLDMNMAYNNARLLNRPESEWLLTPTSSGLASAEEEQEEGSDGEVVVEEETTTASESGGDVSVPNTPPSSAFTSSAVAAGASSASFTRPQGGYSYRGPSSGPRGNSLNYRQNSHLSSSSSSSSIPGYRTRKCMNFGTPSGCKYGDACTFVHEL